MSNEIIQIWLIAYNRRNHAIKKYIVHQTPTRLQPLVNSERKKMSKKSRKRKDVSFDRLSAANLAQIEKYGNFGVC